MKSSQGSTPRKRKTKRKAKDPPEGGHLSIQPLSFYLSDRKSLLEQMFLSVDEETVHSLLLPTLQDKSLDDLKLICQTQLVKLTDSEVLKLITGASQQVVSVEQEPDNALHDVHTRPGQLLLHDSEEIGIKKLKIIEKPYPEESIDGSTQLSCGEVEDISLNEKGLSESPNLNVDEASTGESWLESKTEREIMELEFRARAIRSLMRSQGLASLKNEDSCDGSATQQRTTD